MLRSGCSSHTLELGTGRGRDAGTHPAEAPPPPQAAYDWDLGGCLSPVTPADAAGSGGAGPFGGLADGRRLLSARRPVAYEDL